MMKNLILAFFVFTAVVPCFAQKDVANSKDHPLLSRYDGSWINRYSQKQFETFAYPTSSEMVDYNKLKEFTTVEGELTFIEYASPEGVTATQVFRTYETQLAKAGFKTIYSCKGEACGDMPMHFSRSYIVGGSSQLGNTMVGKKGSYLVASGSNNGESFIVSFVVGDDRRQNLARYAINVVKVEELDTDKVDVASVTDKIETEGRYAFYGINFELNSAAVGDGSGEALQVIADYIKANPNKKVLIVGHTDSSGDFEHNMGLSRKRAESVVATLASDYGVNAKQMTAVGVGMAAPMASNTEENGRALNRRVELVVR